MSSTEKHGSRRSIRRGVQRDDVTKFIRAVKYPEKFLEYCKKFHEYEPRDIAYVVSRSIVSRDPNNMSFKLAGAKIIIISWNAAKFLRLSREVKAGLENDILDAYEKSEERLRELEGKRLELLDLADGGVRDDIKYVFSEFSSKKSIGFTGASKILHIINPNVFMMWDASIRNAYHKLHDKGHKSDHPECYLEFLKQTQDIVRALLSKRTEEDLWNDHLTFLDKSFIEAFSFKENVLKMLDECNYVRFKLNMEL